MSYIEDIGCLVTGSWDCTVKIWSDMHSKRYKLFRTDHNMLDFLSCDDHITCLDSRLSSTNTISVIIGTKGGDAYLWSNNNFNRDKIENSVIHLTKSRRFSAISGLIFSSDGTKFAICDNSGHLVMYFLHSKNRTESNDNYNIVELFERNLDTTLTCLNWGFNSDQLMVTGANGILYVFNMAVGRVEMERKMHNGQIYVIEFLAGGQFVTAGIDNTKHCIKLWSCPGDNKYSLNRDSLYQSCASPAESGDL